MMNTLLKMTRYKANLNKEHKFFCLCTLIDIGGLLVPSVLKSNQIAQHVVSDVGNKAKQNGNAGRHLNSDI